MKAGGAVMQPIGSVQASHFDPPWLKYAIADIGIKEYAGKKHNPLIVKMFSTIKMSGIKDDETPWCAAFVGAKLEQADIRSTRSAWALSYSDYGQRLSEPKRGCIGYKKRVNSAGKLIGGHVFFVLGQDKNGNILALGGNQGNAVSVATYKRSDIVGYRWPVGTPPRDTLPVMTLATASAVSEA